MKFVEFTEWSIKLGHFVLRPACNFKSVNQIDVKFCTNQHYFIAFV